MNKMIITDNVSYEYKVNSEESHGVKAIDRVSVQIDKGEFVVVLGRNGSGKSTLARLLNALLLPQKGTIFVDGLDTKNGELLWDIRRNLGLVLQNPDNQIVATTVEEDIAFGPENLGLVPTEIRKRVDDSARLVGMEEYLEYSPHMLSGGQKQRVAIAGILAMQPKCIVLDESTSMLDPRGRKEVMKVLHSLNKNNGITIVLITHHMDEAAAADHVLVMQDGSIVLEGSPLQIFQNVDVVRRAGLDVPHITALAKKLREKGLNIKELPVDMEDMINLLKDKFSNMHRKGFQVKKHIKLDNDKTKEISEDIILVDRLNHVYLPDTTFERQALKDISIAIKKGEILGIIGQTGSGKSTLVQHFNGILKPTSGSLKVDGLDTSGKDLKELRRRVGLIFQYPEHQLFDETVYKDITFGLQKMGLSPDEIKNRVFHVIDILGISPELLEKSPFELSGGQKRRVAIAGVLVMEPKVLILDEPTAGLDPQGSIEVFKLLRRLNRDEGVTIIIISHSMDDIASLCHRVAVMHEGTLVMCDTTREVFKRHNELKSYGLDIPSITQLFLSLNELGLELPSPVLTVDEACDILTGYLLERDGGEG